MRHIFFTPSYLKIPAFGLDLSDRSFKYASFKKSSAGVRLGAWGSGEIPEGIIRLGELHKVNDLAVILAEKLKHMKLRYAVVSLPEERGFVRDIRLPMMSGEDIHSALEFKLSEHIPLKPEEAIFDYEVVPHTHAQHIDVVVYAFPRELLGKYVNLCAKINILPVAFELEAHGIARAALSPSLDYSVLLADFGATHVSFMVVYRGVVYFTATIDVAGFELDRAIVEHMKVSYEEAEKLKKGTGLMGRDARGEAMRQSLIPVVKKIVNEMKRHIDFWQSHNKETGPVKELVLTGADSNLYGLTDFIYDELQIPVRLANVWDNVHLPTHYVPEIHFNDSLGFAGAIGLAMRSFSNEI